MFPLGLIKTRGRNYWVYQMSGYDRERYFVVAAHAASRRAADVAMPRASAAGL